MFKKFIVIATVPFFLSCGDDNDSPEPGTTLPVPENYSFERVGESTVDFSGQTTRILMAEELVSATKDFSSTEVSLMELYRNEDIGGNDIDPFENPDLNASTKSIKEKVAISFDLFSTNTSESMEIKNFFESMFVKLENEIYPNENQLATPGNAGQLADGSSTRYVSPTGLEYDQLINKGLIGALMVDQAINHYLSPDVLDQNSNREDNTNKVFSDGSNYTRMEHFWDEAYGYFYGTAANTENPNLTIGEDDSFVNKYIGRMEGDPDFAGTAERIFNALKLGRSAIVANDYELRDEQIAIIRNEISQMIAVRAVFYMQQAKNALPDNRSNYSAYGPAFHDLSEGYGFIYSLRFTRDGETGAELFSRQEVDTLINKLLNDGSNGLWDVKEETLDEISQTISAKFNFSIEQAAS